MDCFVFIVFGAKDPTTSCHMINKNTFMWMWAQNFVNKGIKEINKTLLSYPICQIRVWVTHLQTYSHFLHMSNVHVTIK